jgi:hypothetical protein
MVSASSIFESILIQKPSIAEPETQEPEPQLDAAPTPNLMFNIYRLFKNFTNKFLTDTIPINNNFNHKKLKELVPP